MLRNHQNRNLGQTQRGKGKNLNVSVGKLEVIQIVLIFQRSASITKKKFQK